MRPVSPSTLTVKDLRERVGLTQRKVSVALDVRTSTISDWERGIVVPRLPFEKIRMLLHLYECTFDELADAFEVVKESKHEGESQQQTDQIAVNSEGKHPIAV
jgi:transcriptional regulator with XRE-family HTH domain